MGEAFFPRPHQSRHKKVSVFVIYYYFYCCRSNSFSGLADIDQGYEIPSFCEKQFFVTILNFLFFREAESEMQKLSQLAEQLNPKLNETSSTDQVDLDQLFNFLSKEVPDSIQSGSIRSSSVAGSSETPEKSSILDEIDRQMSDLQNEIDRYSLRSENSKTPPPPPPPEEEREPSPPPLPPPIVCGTPPTQGLTLGKPSLPEPEGPPPPPPVQNGYAFNNPMATQNNNQNKEPIYESIKPRPEPLGGCGDDEPNQEYGFTKPINGNGQIYGSGPDREARRVLRVQRELERIQEAENEDKEEEHFHLLEFAENYFNEHEKSPTGTIGKTFNNLNFSRRNYDFFFFCSGNVKEVENDRNFVKIRHDFLLQRQLYSQFPYSYV